MNKTSVFFLVMCSLGCSSAPTGANTGAVTFHWNFNGKSCANANVDVVQVQIAGSTTTWSCWDPVAQIEGATIAAVPQGLQAFTLTGMVPTYDATTGAFAGDVPWLRVSGQVQVMAGFDNDTGVLVLTYITAPASMNSSNVSFVWTFAGQGCAQAPMVDHLHFVMTGVTPTIDTSFACNSSASVMNLPAGGYPFTLTAVDAAGAIKYFQSGGTATVDGANSISINTDLQAMVGAGGTGNAEIDFTFGTSAQNCQQVGVDTLHYSLTDATGAVIANTDLMQGCLDSSSQPSVGIAFSALQPAVYYLYIQGFAQQKITYQLSGYQFTVVASPTPSTYKTVISKL